MVETTAKIYPASKTRPEFRWIKSPTGWVFTDKEIVPHNYYSRRRTCATVGEASPPPYCRRSRRSLFRRNHDSGVPKTTLLSF